MVAEAKQDVAIEAAAMRDVVLMEAETPWFKPKKGSVFPAKRRSVKKMMFYEIVHCVLPCFDSLFKSNRSANRVHSK
ncbi:Hypothetical predicted protein [Olea europaea subsp. europaea]|uniref:Uncharacterized protein n=1 Tax=Olea europaea subsp. europaea TaxID=158383 RepID=A0A8S0V8S4_OLEEU|nr:Hypothetical predicted protein [Olea europaea subsp. europaea]